MNYVFQTKTPPSAVPPGYFAKVHQSRLTAWCWQWLLPRCPQCHRRKARAIELHGSFIIYRCGFCEQQWKDIG